MSETTTLLKVGSHRPGAAHDRGRRGHARPDPGEPDPGHPRGQPRHHRPAQGPAGQRPGGQRAGHPAASTTPKAARLRRPARRRPGRRKRVLDLWGRTLDASRPATWPLIDREIDWVTKYQLIERYRAKHDLTAVLARGSPSSTSPTTTSTAAAGCTTCWSARAQVDRVATDLEIFEAKDDPAADHPGPAARRVHPPRPGEAARLHRRLGAPQAQRPGPAHGAVQGPVPLARRAGGEAHRRDVRPIRRRPSWMRGSPRPAHRILPDPDAA